MEYKTFPLMGFPGETNKPDGTVVYQCFFPTARIALWKVVPFTLTNRFELNLYRPFPDDAYPDDTLTDYCDRFDVAQEPIPVNCVMEAQLAINFLVQKYLPTEVTNDFSNASEAAGQRNPVSDEERHDDMYSHAATGEAVE
jgi:hypothetical protein